MLTTSPARARAPTKDAPVALSPLRPAVPKMAEGVTNRHVEQQFNRHCVPFRLADDYELFTDLLRQIRRGAIC